MLATMLGAASDLRPFKYDHFLYGVDVRFGTAISFVVGSVFKAQPLAFAILYAAHIRRARQGSVDVLTMMWLNAIVGYGLYFLYPAAGPLYAFGGAFPAAPPEPAHVALRARC